MHQDVDRLADGFFGGRVAKQAPGSLIPARDDPCEVSCSPMASSDDSMIDASRLGVSLGLSYRFGRLVAEAGHLQMRFDHREQLARAEWLDQIVNGLSSLPCLRSAPLRRPGRRAG